MLERLERRRGGLNILFCAVLELHLLRLTGQGGEKASIQLELLCYSSVSSVNAQPRRRIHKLPFLGKYTCNDRAEDCVAVRSLESTLSSKHTVGHWRD